MKQVLKILALTVLLFSCTEQDGGPMDPPVFQQAVKAFGAKKGTPNLCVLTNAPYVKLGESQKKAYLERLINETGCSKKNGNLIFFHRSSSGSLLTALFYRKTGDCMVIYSVGTTEKTIRFKIQRESVATPDFWAGVTESLDASDAFSIVSILGAWWLDAPRDFIASAEKHGHVCPGLVFGYFAAKIVGKDYPLQPGEHYLFVATNPNFCGNDAIRVVLNVSEDKNTLFLREWTPAQRKVWSIRDGLGIFVLWKEKKQKGTGIIPGIKMSLLEERTGFKKPSKEPYEMAPAVFKLIPYLNQFFSFATVQTVAPVTLKQLERLKDAEQLPHEIMGQL